MQSYSCQPQIPPYTCVFWNLIYPTVYSLSRETILISASVGYTAEITAAVSSEEKQQTEYEIWAAWDMKCWSNMWLNYAAMKQVQHLLMHVLIFS